MAVPNRPSKQDVGRSPPSSLPNSSDGSWLKPWAEALALDSPHDQQQTDELLRDLAPLFGYQDLATPLWLELGRRNRKMAGRRLWQAAKSRPQSR